MITCRWIYDIIIIMKIFLSIIKRLLSIEVGNLGEYDWQLLVQLFFHWNSHKSNLYHQIFWPKNKNMKMEREKESQSSYDSKLELRTRRSITALCKEDLFSFFYLHLDGAAIAKGYCVDSNDFHHFYLLE